MRATISIPAGLAYVEGERLPDNGTEQAVLHAAANTAHSFRGGLAALAKRMDVSPGTLQHKINLNNTTHHLSAVELARLMHCTGDYSAGAAMMAAGGYVCILANPTEAASVADGMARVTEALGEFFNAVRDATDTGTPTTRQQNRRSEFALGELLGAANALMALQRARAPRNGGEA